MPNASHCLCCTASAGSIDSTASRILALGAARPSHRVPRISIRSLQLIQALGLRIALRLGVGSELVVLVFKQDVERGQRWVTARDVLLQVELVRIAQFAWHAVASAKEGRSRSPSARELADYSRSSRFCGRMSRTGTTPRPAFIDSGAAGTARSTSLRAGLLPAIGLVPTPRAIAMLYVIHV